MYFHFHFHANQTYFDMEGFARGFVLKQKQKVVTRKGYMYNALTNPSMKMRGHNTLETPLVSPFVFTALGSTLGKIVGIRQTKRPTTTARPQSSFRSVGLFRKMRTLWKNNNRKQNRHRHCVGYSGGLFSKKTISSWLWNVTSLFTVYFFVSQICQRKLLKWSSVA